MSEQSNADAGRSLEGRPNDGAATGVAPPAPGSAVIREIAQYLSNRDFARELEHAADNYDRLMVASRKMWVAFARRTAREAHEDSPDAMIELLRAWRELGEIVDPPNK
jgi:uncharacterized lipoprotein YmbA